MSFRSVVAVIRHGDRTPKQKMKMEVRHPKFFELFDKYAGNKKGHVKVKKPRWSTCPLVFWQLALGSCDISEAEKINKVTTHSKWS